MDTVLVVSLLATTIAAGASLLYATLGEILTERSGVMNLGLEGLMLAGALGAFVAARATGDAWVGVGAAMLAGGGLALLHALLAATLRANQVVAGLALTILGTGLASFLGRPHVGLVGPRFGEVPLPLLGRIPLLGEALFRHDPLVYAAYVLAPLAWLYLFRTRPGLHLRAAGENPAAADALGVRVASIRYLYTVAGGMLVAVGGAHLSLAYTPGWSEGMTAGRGWIAIALVIFSTWSPGRAVVGAILFGGINAVQFRMQAAGVDIPAPFLNMLPYISTIAVLVLIARGERRGRRRGAPAALGLAYAREEGILGMDARG